MSDPPHNRTRAVLRISDGSVGVAAVISLVTDSVNNTEGA
jgi:hypothetical protein